MLRRSLNGLVVVNLLAASAHAGVYSNRDPAQYLKEWCERPAKSASFNLGQATLDRLAHDLSRQLDLLKVKGAKAQVSVDDDKLTILITYTYARPERFIVGKTIVNGIVVGYTERIDYGWRVYVVARKGKLVTSSGGYVSDHNTYGSAY